MGDHISASHHIWRPDGWFYCHIFHPTSELCPGPPAKLLLKDGTEFHGYSFGYVDQSYSYENPDNLDATGECVFSTAMVGYAEALTDPSFLGQILVTTYPTLGNTGVPSDEKVRLFHLLVTFCRTSLDI